jgi:hypothetical protein
MGDALFHYHCRESTHQQLYLFGVDGHEARNPITLYEREWAYCPSGLPVGHRWEHVAGVGLAELRRAGAEARA